ncbi:MAG: TnpV protein [Clostridia bacterium]|nr:TnpV protein [Clostridia bacterium]
MKSLFEQNGGTYTQCGDYLLPNMGLTELERKPLGKYGMMRRKYLEESRQGLYTRLLLSGKLMEHLQEIDATCSRRMEQMIREMAVAEGVTEELKAKEQMAWVRKMNSLHAAAEEILLKELVYA